MPTRRTLMLASAACGLGAGAFALPVAAQAQDAAIPPTQPPELADALPGAAWLGTAGMRFFTFNVYDANLWAPPGFSASRYAQSPFALQLNYLRSLDGPAIAERSLVEMRRGGPLTPAQEQRWLAAMQEIFPNVKAGDRITGLHQPGVGARFWFNGTPRGAVADAEFSRLFFGIWLAETTSEPRLRTALLGKAAP